jgi:hypothetical protein
MKRRPRKRTTAVALRGSRSPNPASWHAFVETGKGLVGEVHRFHSEHVKRSQAKQMKMTLRESKKAATAAAVLKFRVSTRSVQRYVREREEQLARWRPRMRGAGEMIADAGRRLAALEKRLTPAQLELFRNLGLPEVEEIAALLEERDSWRERARRAEKRVDALERIASESHGPLNAYQQKARRARR